MKIAVASERNGVASHFGHCEKFVVFEVKGGEIINNKVVENPGHEPGLLPRLLAREGVNVVIAGGMGMRAQQLFAQNNIQVVAGASGSIKEVVKAFLQGNLVTGPNLCDH